MRKNMPRDFVRGKANAVFDALRLPSWPSVPCIFSFLNSHSQRPSADSYERVSSLHGILGLCLLWASWSSQLYPSSLVEPREDQLPLHLPDCLRSPDLRSPLFARPLFGLSSVQQIHKGVFFSACIMVLSSSASLSGGVRPQLSRLPRCGPPCLDALCLCPDSALSTPAVSGLW